MTDVDRRPDDAPPAVLLVEHLAHRREGHARTSLTHLGHELEVAGYQVHVLTSSGLAEGPAARPSFRPATVRRVARPWRRWVDRLPTAAPDAGAGRLRHRLAGIVRQVVLVRSVARAARRVDGADLRVLVLSIGVDPSWANVLAPGQARWVVYVQDPIPDEVAGSPAFRLISAVGARRARRRAERGAAVRCCANHPAAGAAWAAAFPWLQVDVVPMSGVFEPDPVERAEARARLGLPANEPVALHFGLVHAGKDVDTVVGAFLEGGAPACLVLAGAGGDDVVERMRRAPPAASDPIVVLDGPQSDDQKHLLFSAADLVILSYRPGRPNDSAVLTDAVSYGLPVCCSVPSAPGSLVERWGLGHTFAQGDRSDLRAAMTVALQEGAPPGDLPRFAATHDFGLVARRLVDLADSPSDGALGDLDRD